MELATIHIAHARRLVDTIKTAVTSAHDAIVQAYRERVWEPLGYASWDELCEAEFKVRLRLPVDERREAVGNLRAAGLSTRAIGSALGLSKDTVQRESPPAGVSNETPAGPVTGLDGKRYQPRRDTPPPIPTPQADAIRERLRVMRRLTIWHNHVSNLLDAMREAVTVADLDAYYEHAAPDALGDMRDRDVQRLRDIAAAASALADHIDRRPALRRIK